MSVFVINQRNEPLMPCNPRKAKLLLKQGKARVIKRTAFTIQLLQATGETKQEITLGVDTGSKTIGLSSTTENKELFSAELELRTDIVDLLSDRRQYRRTRRNRKTRYRKARFLNRVSSKHKCWLAPSIENRKTGGNSPSNLITLCEECHKYYHKDKLKLNFKKGQSFKDATFMGIMR